MSENNDKTIIRPTPRTVRQTVDDERTVFQSAVQEPLLVDVLGVNGETIGSYEFVQGFSVGRSQDNQIVINHDTISRNHVEIKPDNGSCWITNLNSTNGVYYDANLIQSRQQLALPFELALGRAGIRLRIQTKQSKLLSVRPTQVIKQSRPLPSQTDLEARLLADKHSDDMGEYTLMVRRVIQQDRVQRRKSYKKVIGLLSIAVLAAIGLLTYQHVALSNTQKLALDMFYDIKALEVNLAQADIKLDENAEILDHALQAISDDRLRATQEKLKQQQAAILEEKQRMQAERERLSLMKAKYQQYVEEANALRLSFPTAKHYEVELIAKVSRELGESELELPEEFVNEVRKYIGFWQASSRLPNAIAKLEQNDMLSQVLSTLDKQGLSPYFIYLPLQESNYDIRAVGPETRFGVAKGAWQLLAGTAQQYGLTVGPLAASREFDEQDGRFDFVQATQAGVKYLKRIYSTEAAASGLLVMASYNYGDNRVRDMIRQMPDNPKERNFWKFLQQYQLPAETRDYVLYIFSAAVIGEDPQHFGFKFNPPLYKLKS
ncbi:MAG: hypothetical protein RLZ92_2137 [Pseudomonadota bacterium]|jgi:pSer/pThr/pTyr-binding forkhead associated (FHA) protein